MRVRRTARRDDVRFRYALPAARPPERAFQHV